MVLDFRKAIDNLTSMRNKTDKKKRNLAETFIAFHRNKFFTIYPSELHFLLELTHSSDYVWTEEGLIESGSDYPLEENYITEAGWDSMENAGFGRYPTSWPEADKRGVFFTIPENAHADWLNELWGLVCTINKMDEDAYRMFVTGHAKLQRYTEVATNDMIERPCNGLRSCKAMLSEYKVGERIQRIGIERHEKTLPPPPPEVKVGVTVRAILYEQTAKVLSIDLVQAEYVMEVCRLDTAINGKFFWMKSKLTPVNV